MKISAVLGALMCAAISSGCVSVTQTATLAPEPRQTIDMARFYTGTWLEVARRPMIITTNCPAGSTSYKRTGPMSVYVYDACEVGGPGGRQRSIDGDGTILDPGKNAKIKVQYTSLIAREYWIIDRADDYSWFIEASPDFRDLYIFTRRVPTKAQLSRLVSRAKALGYDVEKLEFPEQPPSRIPRL